MLFGALEALWLLLLSTRSLVTTICPLEAADDRMTEGKNDWT